MPSFSQKDAYFLQEFLRVVCFVKYLSRILSNFTRECQWPIDGSSVSVLKHKNAFFAINLL